MADELAGAAELAQGKLGGRPFAVVRGRADLVLPVDDDGPGAVALVRADGADMFGYGAREAVLRALARRPPRRGGVRRPGRAPTSVAAVLAETLGVDRDRRRGRAWTVAPRRPRRRGRSASRRTHTAGEIDRA